MDRDTDILAINKRRNSLWKPLVREGGKSHCKEGFIGGGEEGEA